jgi:hypothetical protein
MKTLPRKELQKLVKEIAAQKTIIDESDLPTGLNALQKTFLRCLAESPSNLADAARKAAVPRKTVYNWQSSNAPFKKACLHVRETALDIAESKLISLMLKGNLSAIKFWLNAHGQSRGYGKICKKCARVGQPVRVA